MIKKTLLFILLVLFLTPCFAKSIDIFGDGTAIYDSNNLPQQIINQDGVWKKNKTEVGIGYSLITPSQAYLDILAAEEAARLAKEAAKQAEHDLKKEKIKTKLKLSDEDLENLREALK